MMYIIHSSNAEYAAKLFLICTEILVYSVMVIWPFYLFPTGRGEATQNL
jgi:hypothetical protein